MIVKFKRLKVLFYESPIFYFLDNLIKKDFKVLNSQ